MWRRFVIVVAAACGSAPPAPARPTPPADGGRAIAEASPDARECDALFAHAVELAAAEQRAATADDRSRVQGELQAELGASCRAMPRADYRCALAAHSLADLDACGYATRSSSTSNSSVAPGGITPPAPRLP
ncbi:MAG TPA: hypothetical protein VLX92_18490 [Kofleriaceae bacterium]|nr:hypothetical protein [Kofleriaceae bacterium]